METATPTLKTPITMTAIIILLTFFSKSSIRFWPTFIDSVLSKTVFFTARNSKPKSFMVPSNSPTFCLRSSNSFAGKNRQGGVIAAAILVSPVALLFKGKDVTVEKGRKFRVYVDRDYRMTL